MDNYLTMLYEYYFKLKGEVEAQEQDVREIVLPEKPHAEEKLEILTENLNMIQHIISDYAHNKRE